MITSLLLQLGLGLVEVVMAAFSFLPVLSLPGGFAVTVAVPFLSTTGLNEWFTTSIVVISALAVGKGLQWLYGLIPFKGT